MTAKCPARPLVSVKPGDMVRRHWGNPKSPQITTAEVTRVTAAFVYATHVLSNPASLGAESLSCDATYHRKTGRQVGGYIPAWITSS